MINNTKIPVEGHPNLFRDPSSNAVINSDISGYKNYIESVKRARLERDKMLSAIDELQSVKSEVQEIKQMLALLLSQTKA